MASPGKKAFALRIDPELWTQIERLAAAELRSVNAQVEYLLRDAVRQRLGPHRHGVGGAEDEGLSAKKSP